MNILYLKFSQSKGALVYNNKMTMFEFINNMD